MPSFSSSPFHHPPSSLFLPSFLRNHAAHTFAARSLGSARSCGTDRQRHRRSFPPWSTDSRRATRNAHHLRHQYNAAECSGSTCRAPRLDRKGPLDLLCRVRPNSIRHIDAVCELNAADPLDSTPCSFSLNKEKTACICHGGKVLSPDGSLCVARCVTGWYNLGNGSCATCPSPFFACSNAVTPTRWYVIQLTTCLSFAALMSEKIFSSTGTFFYNKACVSECPAGTWGDGAPGSEAFSFFLFGHYDRVWNLTARPKSQQRTSAARAPTRTRRRARTEALPRPPRA